LTLVFLAGKRSKAAKNNRKKAVMAEGAFARRTKIAEVEREKTPKRRARYSPIFVFKVILLCCEIKFIMESNALVIIV